MLMCGVHARGVRRQQRMELQLLSTHGRALPLLGGCVCTKVVNCCMQDQWFKLVCW